MAARPELPVAVCIALRETADRDVAEVMGQLHQIEEYSASQESATAKVFGQGLDDLLGQEGLTATSGIKIAQREEPGQEEMLVLNGLNGVAVISPSLQEAVTYLAVNSPALNETITELFNSEGFAIVYEEGVTGGAAIETTAGNRRVLVVDAVLRQTPAAYAAVLYRLALADALMRYYLATHGWETAGMAKSSRRALESVLAGIPRNEEVEDWMLSYYYRFAIYSSFATPEKATVVEAANWLADTVAYDPMALGDLLTLAESYDVSSLPEPQEIMAGVRRHYALSNDEPLITSAAVRLRALFVSRLPKEIGPAFDPILYALAIGLARNAMADAGFQMVMNGYFAAVENFNAARIALGDAWVVNADSRKKMAVLVATTRAIFVLATGLSACEDMSTADRVWSLVYKLASGTLKIESSDLSLVHDATVGLEGQLQVLYRDLHAVYVDRMQVDADLLDLGVDQGWKPRFTRMKDIASLMINRYPLPQVVRAYPVERLAVNSRVNILRWTEWNHNPLYILQHAETGEGVNFIMNNPWSYRGSFAGDALTIEYGLLREEDGSLVFAEFSEPLTVHYISFWYTSEYADTFERMGIPCQAPRPVHEITQDKKLATDAVRSDSEVRVIRESPS